MRWLVVAVAVVGCGSNPPPPAPTAPRNTAPAATPDEPPAEAAAAGPPPALQALPVPAGTMMPTMPPPLCQSSGLRVDNADVNGDGKVDVRKLVELVGGQDVVRCKLVDFDHDGRFDWASVSNTAGALVLELLDLDFDGRIDAAMRYTPGSLGAVTSRDLDGDGRVDRIEATYPTPP